MRVELGNNTFISLANCLSREEGSRDVVMTICGSARPALPYSSSTPPWWEEEEVFEAASRFASSYSDSDLSRAKFARSSVGRGFPEARASRMRFFDS